MKGVDITMSMEHEQINDKSIALCIRSTKLTGQLLAKAMAAALRQLKNPKLKHGEQSVKSLSKHGASLADIDISGDNIGTFRKIAREHNVDFALKCDKSAEPPKWIVFFKAEDDKAIQSAFKEYANITLKPKAKKPSMLEKLGKFKELVRTALIPARNRNKGGHEL